MRRDSREKFPCRICGAKPGYACDNSVTGAPRDRRHRSRPGGPQQ